MTAPSPSRRKPSARSLKKGDDTRAHILNAARECFNRDGISHVTCRTIAKQAGLSAGNVYYYFANIDFILQKLRQRLDEVMHELLDGIANQDLKTPEAREQAVRLCMDTAWRWRFFFLDIHQLTRTEAREDVLSLQHKSIALHQRLYEGHLESCGMVLDAQDRSLCRDLAVANWLISVHWLQYMCSEKGEMAITKDEFDASLSQSQIIGRLIYDDTLILRLADKLK